MLRYRKNALTGVTRAAATFLLGNGAAYAIFLILAMSTYMAVEVVIGEQLISDNFGGLSGFENFPSILSLTLTALATAIFATPLHDFIINGSRFYVPLYAGRVLIFALIEFLLSLTVFFGIRILLTAVSTAISIGIEFFWAAAVLIAAAFLGVIATTVLPHVAITPVKNLNIRYSIALSSGFRWSIFARFLRLSVFLGLIHIGGGRLLSLLAPHLPPDDTIIGYYAPLFIENLWYSASALIFVTLASMIYLRLSAHERVATAQV